MRLKTKISLHKALWLIVGVAVVPLFLLTAVEYQSKRERAILELRADVQGVVRMALADEQAAVRQAQLVLQLLAQELNDNDAAACNQVARRLLRGVPDILANLGAVSPQGAVFCSALPNSKVINVADRQWFKSAQASEKFGLASFIVGRISGLPSIIFSQVLRTADGSLRAALYAASQPVWFDRLVESFQLAEGWEATLMTRTGKIITRHPDPERWRLQDADPAFFLKLKEALAQPGFVGQLDGVDGVPRMYGVAPLASTAGDVFVVIGAPVGRSLAQLDRDALTRLSFLILIALASGLFARFFIYRLLESSIDTLRKAVGRLAEGDLATRVEGLGALVEFDELGKGFNVMAAALQWHEAELRRLSSAIEQSPESVVMTDAEANIIYVNQAFTRISGYTLAEVLGKNPRILQSGYTPKATYADLWQTLHRRQVWRGELKNIRKDGSFYDELATIVPIVDADGQVSHYIAVKQDLTEKKRIDAELEEHREHLEELVTMRTWELSVAKEKAEVANRAKSSFLANMSHEIRTPLNAILGMSYLLGRSPLSPEQHDKLGTVAAAGKHLMLVINDILELAKIESGTVELHVAPFDPAAVVEEIGALIGEAAHRKGLAIDIDTGTLPHRVIGDATRLRQALLNLAGNAVKFTAQGSVSLRGEILTEDTARVELRFTVVDTGPGISAADQLRLFTAFEQVDNSASRVHGGTGLGLVITRRLAHLMGGEVGLTSRLGQGSSFWLKVRVDRSNGVAAPVVVPTNSATDQSESRQLKAHILLAEDDPVNQDVAVGLLEMLGCQVDVADNGAEAVKMAADHRYDLILMDIQMPVLNGIDATERIRQFAQCQNIPILAMTANVLADDRTRCLRHGMNVFIPKPIVPEQLFSTLLRWLPKSAVAAVPPDRAPSACLPLPAAEMAAALERLAAALAAGDHEASGIFLRFEGHLAAAYGDALSPLKNAIDRFDYEKAGLLLADLVSGQ